MAQSMKPFGVVTGASSGIGFELARQFLENGFDVLVTAEDEGIFTAAQQLKIGGHRVIPFQADLTEEGGVDRLWQAIESEGRPLEAIALNAGVGAGGAFADNALSDEMEIIDLNIKATTHLAKHAVQHMKKHNKGRILFTASIVSVMPNPFQAVYAASKAYVLSLSNALRNELKETGITVTSLMPGATDTNFFVRANMTDTEVGKAEKDDPADVARDGFKAMMAGEGHVVAHSAKNKLQGAMADLMPESLKAEILRKQSEPESVRKSK